jgi:hypothetical protein
MLMMMMMMMIFLMVILIINMMRIDVDDVFDDINLILIKFSFPTFFILNKKSELELEN